jgi:hypothetical protein
MNERLATLTRDLERQSAGDVGRLARVAQRYGISLPSDYVEFMAESDGATGDVGSTWVEVWPVEEVESVADGETPYEGVMLFAGDGANTVYGFDVERQGEIVEGDWIGLRRDQVIPRGHTFLEFLESLQEE